MIHRAFFNPVGEALEKIPKEEINHRIDGFQKILRQGDLDGAILMQNVDMYYFSGTIQSDFL